MQKIKFSLYSLGFFLLLIICCSHNHNEFTQDHIISIRSATDSSRLIFCNVLIFKNGECVIDTNADINGEFLFNGSIEKIVLIYPGTYPRHINFNELKKDSVFYLDRSYIMMKTGGMGYDETLSKSLKKIETDIVEWNKENCPY